MTRLGLRVRAWWAALTAVLLVAAGGAIVLPAAPVQAAPVSITCEPGVVYSVSQSGQIREISGGSPKNVGDAASRVSNFNGLGIGPDGSATYAYERNFNWLGSETGLTVFRFNSSTGKWASTGKSVTVSGIGFIGGAVDLSTGRYYFGGYTRSGTSFRLYVYDASTNAIAYKGTIDTSAGSGGAANGDIAFDTNGNLFIVRGSETTTTVFSVTAASLAKANGGTIASSNSAGFTTNSNVNGVSFDAAGKAYLGTGDTITSYDMPNWSNKQSFASGSWSSTDLASCSSPATITLQKDVQGGRAKSSDQFGLSLKQGDTELGATTTTGTATGIQDEIVGPLPAKRGAEITFSESAATGADLGDYARTYSCTVDGKELAESSGTGTSGTVTIPNTGEAVVCTITNAPLTANVSIHKDVVDENGANKKPGQGWTVGAKATATTDSVTSNPTAATHKTNSNGDAKWGLKFSKTTGRATVAISETQQDGFEFKSGSCEITHLDGSKDTKKLTSDKSTDLTGIKPGDNVDCAYVNKVSDTALTLVKKVDNKAAAGTAKDTDWTLKAAGDTASGNKTIEGKTGSTEVTKAKVKAGKYSLSEAGTPKGYEASDWVCKPTSGSGVVTSDKSSVTLKSGDDVTCTITNTAKTGAVTWGKTDESGNALKGSVWTLTGPDGSELTIEDCAAASASECNGQDKDPVAGKFSVTGLKWGDYTLTEKKAPAGYILDDTPHTFTVSGSELDKKLGSYTNEQKPQVALPLTGGTGSQIYLIGGAALLAAAGAIALLKGLRRRNRKH
ncbi:SpaA isopeptide-forming pilin-related protein [Brevibacterium linens]|uniref:LPXTG-motif cell wall anchor domain-containing protein n=1 Tax=Brevibacterium linens ATCC 9172 TaxID=1255617 RepID=A0A2H1JCL5_BRELN|nr:SpaA isopeptide-forming pilin-related protein [Brevibacterium linens]KAB1948156.1 LPXTG cell wall anchor domain-containing protein [Brevibacterium linens ATCC 9172]SMX84892.1 LPXTG-motif cell wall anchor domain-containing protein [Brevibacterium linens ATCC 9172]